MRLGLIGPESTIRVIEKVIKEILPNIVLVKKTTEFFEESHLLAQELQDGKMVDAILFSGPLNYHYVLKRVTPTLPWRYLNHSRVSVYRAFLDASYHYHTSFNAISVDTYDLDVIQEVFDHMGVKDYIINKPDYYLDTPNLENTFLEFHKKCYLEGRANICFTSVEHVYRPLVKQNIPCIRIWPAKEVILEQVYNLQLELLEKGQSDKEEIAVIGIMYNYDYDNEHDLGLRELEKMEYRNAFRRHIYHLAQRLGSGVFFDEVVHYYLVISKDKLDKQFLKGDEYANLLKFGNPENKCQVWVGIGIGRDTLEAKSRANMALNQSLNKYAINEKKTINNSYIVENEFSKKEIKLDTGATQQHRLSILAEQYGLSESTLWRMAHAVKINDGPITAEVLAEKMQITSRSVNRIIAQLEDAGFVTIVGKESSGKGRPARLLQINLPQE